MGSEVFQRLSRELNSSERQEMLQRISALLPQEKLVLREDREDEPMDVEKIYKESPWWERIWFQIQKLFSGKEILQLVEEHCLKSLTRKLKREAHPWFDVENKRATQEFYQLLEKLKNALEPFRDIMQRLGREKEEFVFFLGNRCFEGLEENLNVATDPEEIKKSNENIRPIQVRDKIREALELNFDSITTEKRNQLKWQARSVFHLQQLCEFSFYSFLGQFTERGTSGVEADWQNIRYPLGGLLDILYSFQVFPQPTLLQDMLVFTHRERFLDEEEDDVAQWISGIYKQMAVLKDLLQEADKIPLQKVMQLIAKELSYQPRDIGGGEDFFHIYNKIWQRRTERRYAIFVNREKIAEAERSICSTWNCSYPLPALEPYGREFSKLGRFQFSRSIALLYHFYQELINEKSYPLLDTIWKRGEFYKKDNHREFDDVMKYIHLSTERFESLQNRLKEGGFYKVRLAEILKDYQPQPELMSKEIGLLYQTIDQEVRRFILELMNQLHIMASLLTGILIGERGNYDTLSNFADLAGPPNRLFKEELVTREFQVNNAYKALNDIFTLEEKAPS